MLRPVSVSSESRSAKIAARSPVAETRACLARILESFTLNSTVKVAPTFGVGFTFYPGDFWSLGVEYRALPFSWNRAGFDSRGSGPGGNFPDGQINSADETFQFNQLVTIAIGFYFPTKPKLNE